MTLTYEARLDKSCGGDELIGYFSGFIELFLQIQRYAWQRIKKGNVNKSAFNTEIQKKFNVSKRTANSAITDMMGRFRALKALKRTELYQKDAKIFELEREITKLAYDTGQLREKAIANVLTAKELERYRKLKHKLYYQKLNRFKMRRARLEQRIKDNKYSMCFGTKKLFKAQYNLEANGFSSHAKWYTAFKRKRDANILYTGSQDETQGNQMFQVYYDEINDQFIAQVRMERQAEQYVCGVFELNYKTSGFDAKKHITNILKRHEELGLVKRVGEPHDKPVSCRICRRGRKWYLQILIDIDSRVIDQRTRYAYGVIGLDLNDGFITMSETDEHGNLVKQEYYPLIYKGTGNKAESEMREKISKIVTYCKSVGKDLAIEDLDFISKKARSSKGKNKSYNKMLHTFAYSRYKQAARSCCHKNGVGLRPVDPYMTTVIGKLKYGEQRKLNSHQAASLVIARRGQGFGERLNKSA
jgi:IS605 OrfB family transposase